MGFRTKLDYSDNRQIRQTEKTNTILSGSTVFGVPFSGLTSGPDLSTQYQVSQYIGVISEFSGNTSETNFTWSTPINVSVVDGSLDVILSSNSGLTQSTSVIFEPSSTTIIDDNVVNLTYSGVQVDNLYVLSMSEVSPNNYTGLVSSDFYIFSADTLDFTGRTIWVDNSEILRTDRIIISRGAQPGYVLTSANSEGMGVWSPISGTTSGDSLFETGTTINSTQRKDVGNITDGDYSASLGGQNNIVSGGTHSVIAGGFDNEITTNYSVISGGYFNNNSGFTSVIGGGSNNTTDTTLSTIGGGYSNKTNTGSGGSTIGGGGMNTTYGTLSTIGGGGMNTTFGKRSTIGGGSNNTTFGICSTIGGGSNNTTDGTLSTIGGGFSNCANCFNDTVGGGILNIACGGNSTVAGGNTNTASGPLSSVGGGTLNVGSGWASNVTGGMCNTASGCYTGILGGQCNNTNNLNCAMIVGSNITADRSCTTFVNNLSVEDGDIYIKGLNSIDPLATDSDGKIVPGASDYRLKKNIEPIVNGLDVVKKLKGVSYEYTEESNMGGGLKYGFIAQDVKEVIPTVVKPRGKDTDMLMLNYTEIIPWLVEAIKEITSPDFVKENIIFKTETIKAEDNYIELNYNGTYETSIGGGIIISNAKIDDEEDVYFTLNENSFWVTNAYIKPYGLIIPEYSPSSSDDPFGVYGEVTYDNHYLYIKGGDGWLRTELNKF